MNDSYAFTLVELLVAIAIIGIIAALALPMYQEYRYKAYNANALTMEQDILKAAIDLESELIEKYDFSNANASSTCIGGGIRTGSNVKSHYGYSSWNNINCTNYLNDKYWLDPDFYFEFNARHNPNNPANSQAYALVVPCKGNIFYRTSIYQDENRVVWRIKKGQVGWPDYWALYCPS